MAGTPPAASLASQPASRKLSLPLEGGPGRRVYARVPLMRRAPVAFDRDLVEHDLLAAVGLDAGAATPVVLRDLVLLQFLEGDRDLFVGGHDLLAHVLERRHQGAAALDRGLGIRR